MKMESFMRGTCQFMCSESEIDMRVREKIIHFYELKNGTKNTVDYNKMVKSFTRSAAGHKVPKPFEIRTPQALLKTVDYLIKEVFQDNRRQYYFKYEFIFDRFRAVRQEIVMQNLPESLTVEIMEPIIMFLAYSFYHLCEENIRNFDQKICNTHLQECLKKVLCCYDEMNAKLIEYNYKNRVKIEMLYLALNLGSTEAIKRAINLPQSIKTNLEIAIKMSIEYLQGNFYKVVSLIPKLPEVQCAVASLKLQKLRYELLLRFSVAFQSKSLTVPLEWIQKILLYENKDLLQQDCQYYGIEIVDRTNVRFDRIKFDSSILILQSRHEDFVERKLQDVFLPRILLMKSV